MPPVQSLVVAAADVLLTLAVTAEGRVRDVAKLSSRLTNSRVSSSCHFILSDCLSNYSAQPYP